MFRQVVWILFSLMETFEPYWKKVRGSEPVETFGHRNHIEPEPIPVNLEDLIERFKIGYGQFSSLWKDLFSPESYAEIQRAAESGPADFQLVTDTWVRILYELAAIFHAWPRNRFKIIELVTTLYYARVAHFVLRTKDMTSEEAESLIEEQTLSFERQKDYLIKIWDEKTEQAVKAAQG